MRLLMTAAFVVMSSSAWAQSAPPASVDQQLNRFSAQVRCAEGQVYDESRRACVTVPADTTGLLVGGTIITTGVVAAILIANKGDKSVSP